MDAYEGDCSSPSLCSYVSYPKLLMDFDELWYWESAFRVVMLVCTVPIYSETPISGFFGKQWIGTLN
jgi:hypothetical protein